MTVFLQQLQELLNNTDAIAKDDADKAAKLIRARRNTIAAQQKHLTTAGPCWFCGKAMVQYTLKRVHLVAGEEWYEKFIHAHDDPDALISVVIDGHQVRFSDYPLATVLAYSCEDCQTFINWIVDEHRKAAAIKHRAEVESAQLQQQEQDHAILTGAARASIPKQFNTLYRIMDSAPFDLLLRSEPYQEFLKSPYWNIVRKYKLYKAGFKCELCNGVGRLQVHHKTYEHHGEEHKNLNDLIVLCENCHAKFHNKLPKQEAIRE